MQLTRQYFTLLLPLVLAGMILALSLVLSPVSRAESSQNVTIGVGLTTLTIEGQTSPDTFVTVLQNNTPIGSTSADQDGDFSLVLTFETGGIKQISLFGRTTSGHVTDPLAASINVVDHQDTLYYAFLPPTINLDSPKVASGQNIIVSGETLPGGAVTITADTGQAIQARANQSGQWSATLPTSQPGLYTLFAVAHDDIGQQSAPTRRLSFIIIGSEAVPSPRAPVGILRPALVTAPMVPIITSPQDNQYLNKHTVMAEGIAERDSLVEVWESNRIIGSTYASTTGTWQMSLSLTAPHSVLRARSCRSGICSNFSLPVNVYFSATPSAGSFYSALETSSYSLSGFVGQQINLTLLIENGTAPYRVKINWGDGSTEDQSYATAGRYTLSHAYQSPGRYNGTVTAADSNKVQNIHHFAVRIRERPLSARLGKAAALLGLAVIALLIFRFFIPHLAPRLKRKR